MLTRLHRQAGTLIQAHLGHAVCCLHGGQKLIVLGGGGDRCHPGQAHAHGPTLALAPPAGRGGLAGAPPASDSLLLQRQLWALALPLGSPSCPRHSGSPPGWPTHPPGWEYVPRDLGALSITSWSSSLVRAAFSLFCSLLSMRLTVGSWNLAISNKPAWLPKYSECWDFSTSLCS